MSLVRFAPALAAAALVVGAQGSAQTAPAPTATSATTHTRVASTSKATTHAPVQRTAKSLDCSKQADAKNVHGKARKSFMSSCKKA